MRETTCFKCRSVFVLVVQLCVASFCLRGFAQEQAWYAKVNEGVLFHLGFDKKSVDAGRSVGDGKAKVSGTPEFAPGIKGEALASKDAKVALSFAVAENLSFQKPGSIAFWVKALNWKKPADQPDDKSGNKQRIYQEFFMTKYQKEGYLGLERMSSHLVGKKDTLLLFFAGFEGIKSSISKNINLGDGKWRYVVLTWNPLVWRLYVDGKEVGHCTLSRKIQDSDIADRFKVMSPGRTLIDEVFIYKYALPAYKIAKFHKDYLKK